MIYDRLGFLQKAMISSLFSQEYSKQQAADLLSGGTFTLT